MTAAQKMLEQARQFFLEQIKKNLKAKYPEMTDEEFERMVKEYETVNPPPV